ncbi:MAG: hypothetical protein QNI96_05815 [Woeseiaceae bacterium]|nr:hypothetical protein [Woeseiaceae bacterium]
MSDAVDRGITVTEMALMGESIDVSPETTAAFVGRALRGPLNQPVLVRDFGEFRRRFGASWSRSSLGPAVQQFFDHGGKQLYVVRVANNARGAMLCLPASGSALVLRAVEPGSTEHIRAAVDYDGIEEDNEALFNLTLQRIDPSTGHVIDQETYRRSSYLPDDESFIGDSLLTSALARAENPYPAHRPEPTQGIGASLQSGYVEKVQAGVDGQELTDYDLVGSRRSQTGIFALEPLSRLDLVYLPPPGKNRDLGPASLLAAELFCRERGAMLIVDPHGGWTTTAKAIDGVRRLGLASPNAMTYFPRMLPREGDGGPRAVGGAIAGRLCKQDRAADGAMVAAAGGLNLSRGLVTAVSVEPEDIHTLMREGLNPIVNGPAGRAQLLPSVTLGGGGETQRQFASLGVRRLCLRIVNAIDLGTRWAAFEADCDRVERRVRIQVRAYLAAMASIGMLASERFAVDCHVSHRGLTILVAFRPPGCVDPVSFTLHQGATGCRVATTAFPPVMENCA